MSSENLTTRGLDFSKINIWRFATLMNEVDKRELKGV
jgi:hypothetical protein